MIPTPDPLREMVARWEADAEVIEAAQSGTRPRRLVAAEALRACAADLGAALVQPAPALDVAQLMDAEHRWCVEVEGEFALNHGPDSHRRQATFILAHLSGDPA